MREKEKKGFRQRVQEGFVVSWGSGGESKGLSVNPGPLAGVHTPSRGPSTRVPRGAPGGGLGQGRCPQPYPSRPQKSPEGGLTKGSHSHTVEYYSAMKTKPIHAIRQLTLTSMRH